VLAILTLTAALSAAFADQVVMKNGDRVTGSIIKKDAATLTIKTVHFGTVTLPWDQVDSVKADTPLTVVLPNGKSVEGTIASSGDKIVVTEKSSTETVGPKEIVAIRNADEQKAYLRLLRPRWYELWLITGNISIAGTSGNAETRTFTTPINLVRATRNDKTTAYFNFIRASASVNGQAKETASALRGGWSYNRNLHPKVFATVFNDFEHDRFQNLDLRAVLGGGLGWHAWKKEKGFVDVVAGGDYMHESFGACDPLLTCSGALTTAFSRSTAEAYWGDDLGYKPAKKFAITQSFRMFDNLTDTGNYRMNFDLGFSTSLSKYFTWNAAISDRYLSNPAIGRKKNDFLYSTGFGFTFTK
jgi:hypothetical protein